MDHTMDRDRCLDIETQFLVALNNLTPITKGNNWYLFIASRSPDQHIMKEFDDWCNKVTTIHGGIENWVLIIVPLDMDYDERVLQRMKDDGFRLAILDVAYARTTVPSHVSVGLITQELTGDVSDTFRTVRNGFRRYLWKRVNGIFAAQVVSHQINILLHGRELRNDVIFQSEGDSMTSVLSNVFDAWKILAQRRRGRLLSAKQFSW